MTSDNLLRGCEGEAIESPTVLLVDDSSMQMLLYQVLERGGYNVLAAGNAAEALIICRQFRHPISLLLTGVEMPGMTGFELAEKALQLHPFMRVLFLSAGAAKGTELQNGSGSANMFLPKPFKEGALMDRIKQTLHA